MMVLGVAENMHDSCLSFVVDGAAVLHLELERITRSKRDVFSSPAQVRRLVEFALGRYRMPDPDVVAIVRHAVPRLTPSIASALRERYPCAQVVEIDHLEAHAGLALAAFDEAHVFAVDGGGDRHVRGAEPNGAWLEVSRQGGLVSRRPLPFGSNPIDGRAWNCVAHYIFDDLHAAGKVMGLAAYAQGCESWDKHGPGLVERSLDWRYDDQALQRIRFYLEGSDSGTTADLSAWLQNTYTSSLVQASKALPDARPLALVGGCALNVVTNTAIRAAHPEREVWVPPCPGDEGISLGAALLASALVGAPPTELRHPFVGLQAGHDGDPDEPSETDYGRAADLLADGYVIAVTLGRSEIGPRALGNRSLLCAPTVRNRQRVSEAIKGREPFRPVAPAILAEAQADWLEDPTESRFMSFAATANQRMREFAPGAVHVDGSVRHQSVTQTSSPHLSTLLTCMQERTGVPILINTSLNSAGEPIIGDSADALRFCLRTDVDALLGPAGLTVFLS